MQHHEEIVVSEVGLEKHSTRKGSLGKTPPLSGKHAGWLIGPTTGAGFAIMLGVSSLFQLVMVSPTSEQYDSLLRQMSERIDEGCGETIYVIGQGSGECS